MKCRKMFATQNWKPWFRTIEQITVNERMKFIGIDFSINYPAACIANQDFTDFKWVACINDVPTKKHRKLLEDAMIEFPKLNFAFIEGKQKKTETYHITERNKLKNWFDLTTNFVYQIQTRVGSENSVYAIEGLSYGAAGNTLLDITQATGILKRTLYNASISWAGGPTEAAYVFAPSELKKAIGAKGNANKVDVFNTFMADPKIASIRESDLYKFIVKYRDDVFDGKTVKSPIMDMIDSTLSIVHLKNTLQ